MTWTLKWNTCMRLPPDRFYLIFLVFEYWFLSSLCAHCLFLSGFQQLAVVCLFVCLLPLATCHQRQTCVYRETEKMTIYHALVYVSKSNIFDFTCVSFINFNDSWWLSCANQNHQRTPFTLAPLGIKPWPPRLWDHSPCQMSYKMQFLWPYWFCCWFHKFISVASE